jgi:hypothetical protein
MSKGDGRRPPQIDPATEKANWERTFGKRPRKGTQGLCSCDPGSDGGVTHCPRCRLPVST